MVAVEVTIPLVSIAAHDIAQPEVVEVVIILPEQERLSPLAEHISVDNMSVYPDETGAILYVAQFRFRKRPTNLDLNRAKPLAWRHIGIAPVHTHAANALAWHSFDLDKLVILALNGRRVTTYRAGENRFHDDCGASPVILKAKVDRWEIGPWAGGESEKESWHDGQKKRAFQLFDNVNLTLRHADLHPTNARLPAKNLRLICKNYQGEDAHDERRVVVTWEGLDLLPIFSFERLPHRWNGIARWRTEPKRSL
ncbi:MAG: hypothetical protein QOF70_1474 [Acetobacteraceae bacterium]|nr:hypothetical protein [Acetobacteraceae bacterium]